jgi:hypothetical protein
MSAREIAVQGLIDCRKAALAGLAACGSNHPAVAIDLHRDIDRIDKRIAELVAYEPKPEGSK